MMEFRNELYVNDLLRNDLLRNIYNGVLLPSDSSSRVTIPLSNNCLENSTVI